jgi:YVTN family beta-propeller protein
MDRAKRFGGLIAIVVLLGSLLPAAPPAGAATRLPVRRFGEMVHDREHRRLFVTAPFEGSRIVVVDYDGRIVKTFDDLKGPSKMTLSGGLLYVSLYRANAVLVIDTATLRVTERIDVAPYTNPWQVARAGNYLWVSVNCEDDPRIALIDLSSGEMYDFPSPYVFDCPELLTNPVEEDVLFTWQEGISTTEMYKYRFEPSPVPIVQPPTLTVEAQTRVPDVRDGTIDPTGEHIYLASERVRVLRTSDLVQVGTYPDGLQAVAITADQGYVAGGGLDFYHADVFLYRDGATAEAFKTATPDALGEGGLALAEDATRVFAVTDDLFGRVLFSVITPWFTLRATKRQEVGPAGYQGALAWSETDAPGAARLDAFVETDGNKVKLNRDGTQGVVGGFDDGLVSFAESKGRRGDVFLYDVSSGTRRDPGRKVNSRAIEYLPGVSGPWVLFGRYTHGGRGRALLLYNRESRQVRKLDSVRGRNPVLIPGQMNGSWAVWFDCARQCAVYRYNVKTRKKIRVPRAKKTRDVSPSVAPDGTVYFERAGARCGRKARIMRYRPGRRATVVKKAPSGIEVTATFYSEGPGHDELLVGRFDCEKGQFDLVKSHEP